MPASNNKMGSNKQPPQTPRPGLVKTKTAAALIEEGLTKGISKGLKWITDKMDPEKREEARRKAAEANRAYHEFVYGKGEGRHGPRTPMDSAISARDGGFLTKRADPNAQCLHNDPRRQEFDRIAYNDDLGIYILRGLLDDVVYTTDADGFQAAYNHERVEFLEPYVDNYPHLLPPPQQ